MSDLIDQDNKNSGNTGEPQLIGDIQFPDLSQIYCDLTKQIGQIVCNEVLYSLILTIMQKDVSDGNYDQLESTLIGMLKPFLSKEVLYEPMKDLKTSVC